jgi:hypothetical protein
VDGAGEGSADERIRRGGLGQTRLCQSYPKHHGVEELSVVWYIVL